MEKKSSFSGSLGFVLTAAGSAVGVGNIWRFPYLAAKDGGGLFILLYLVLVLTFGFTLLTTDIAIGRKTGKHVLTVYGSISERWNFLGKLTFIVPVIIMTYYTVIGGWVSRYMAAYMVSGTKTVAQDGYFISFITSKIAPVVFMLVFLAITTLIVYAGVEKGIERFSKYVMPTLLVLIIGVAMFSLTLTYKDSNGVVRTGMQGLKISLLPDLREMTFGKFLRILLDAMSQIFFSLSVSMGIMITYGSYVRKDTNLEKSIWQIGFFDTFVAMIASIMVIPAVFVFLGMEGMSSGPSLMFVSLPKVFEAMGEVGRFIGFAFFLMVTFATLTSCISILETLVGNFIQVLYVSRENLCLIIAVVSAVAATVICAGYNVLYFEISLPNGQIGQLLDVMDYVSNSFLLPLISFLTCIFIGWIVKPDLIHDEMQAEGQTFKSKKLYSFIIKFIAPPIMAILFFQSTGIFKF